MKLELKEKIIADISAGISDERMSGILAEKSLSRVSDGMMHLMRESCISAPAGNINGGMFWYDGNVYAPVDRNVFDDAVYRVMRLKGMPDGTYGRIQSMTRVCRTAVLSRMLEVDKEYVTFQNCVYDVRREHKRHFNPKVVNVSQLDYKYDPKAECKMWEWFLEEVLPEEKCRRLLQEFLGCMYLDRRKIRIEKMLVLIGSGANGKSVISDIVEALIGAENMGRFGIGELISGNDLKKNISSVNGKRLNYCPEISARQFIAEADALKKLISSEAMVARDLFQSNELVKDIPLMMANANQFPRLKEDEMKALTRRLITIPFDVCIPPERQDPKLSQKLIRELPGIFNWVLRGRARFVARKYQFDIPDSARDVLNGYRVESSSVLEFMASKGYASSPPTDMRPTEIPAGELYDEYKRWCLSVNKSVNDIKDITPFGRILGGDGYQKKRKGSHIVYYIYKQSRNI